MSTYNKPFLSPTKQLELLKKRGLEIDDTSALACLKRNGYYRLSAYWYPFREIKGTPPIRTDNFLPGSRFEDARLLYVFDKELKLLLMDVIERVEIAIRGAIALRLGAKDVFAHENPALLETWFTTAVPGKQSRHQKWLEKFDGRVDCARDQFIQHYETKYGTRKPLPIWIAIELWDFGLLSHFYSGMSYRDRRAIAQQFQVPDAKMLGSWLRSLNYVRNVIAHHGRLWNLNLVDNPSLPGMGVIPDFDPLVALPLVSTRVYSVCCVLAYLSKVINPQATWHKKLHAHVKTFPSIPHARIYDMGFPANWESHNFWQ